MKNLFKKSQNKEIRVNQEEKRVLMDFEAKNSSQMSIGKITNPQIQRDRYEKESQKFWRQEDEMRLFSLYKKYGSSWVQIKRKFNEGQGKKSQNTLKNKFYGTVRKVIRFLNKLMKQKSVKKLKPINYESIMKIIEIAQVREDILKNIQMQSLNLKEQFFSFLIDNKKIGDEECLKFVDQMHDFNLRTRCFSFRKKKMNLLNCNDIHKCKRQKKVKTYESIKQAQQYPLSDQGQLVQISSQQYSEEPIISSKALVDEYIQIFKIQPLSLLPI